MGRNLHFSRPTLGLGLCLLAPLLQADEGEPGASHTLSFGSYYGEGDFGEDRDTRIVYLPLSYEYSRDGWRWSASLPWLRISGPGDVLLNIGGVTRPDQPQREPERDNVATSGAGDLLLRATRELAPWSESAPFIDLAVEVKLPLADETQGLGTGARDYALQSDLYQVWGSTTVFVTLGYRWRGQSDWFDGLQDSASVSLGWSRPLLQEAGADAWSWGLIYDYREAASLLSSDIHELLPYLNWSPGGAWSVMAYATRGFSRDSIDVAAGLQLNYRW